MDGLTAFRGKVAIVTGASSGIGAAIAVSLASCGCRLTLTGRSADGLSQTREQSIQAGADPATILLVRADLSNTTEVQQIYTQTIGFHHKLDILVNNAGITHLDYMDSSFEKYQEVLQVNLGSVVQLTNFCSEELVKTRGGIVNISSCVGRMPMPHGQAYSISKAGLDHFMRCKALELGPKGVRVNNISPAGVDTPIMKRAGLPEEMIKMWRDWGHRQFQALDRPLGQPEEVARVVLFLLSDKAGWTTGANVMVDAGATCMAITPDILPPH